ncbi:MAG TPA: glycosyltransferase family 2 protein [Chitinophagaceae bacterium]|nr:glycosyltransferase family 2 protein [Chitinophagaceae bacterium]
MNSPKITIVIPSYNQGQYIEETILSVIEQQYPNLEVFVVDGGSNDNSVDIIKKYEQNITWWVSEKDKGQSDAINKGLKKATGEIITWINSDDLLTPGSLDKVASHFSDLPDTTGLIHGGVIVFKEDRELETRYTYLPPCLESYLSGMAFSQPSAFFRKKYLDKVGFLNNELHYGMDYDLFMRLSLVCNFQPVRDVVSRYRLHDQSKSVAENHKFMADWKRIFVSLCKNLSWHGEIELLKKTGLYANELEYDRSFSFKPEERIISSVDRKKATCFHLGHVLRDLYWNARNKEAKDLMKTMQQNFPQDWINEDTRLSVIISKLKLPGFAIWSLRKLKRIFK